ncbi:MAG: DUF4258 domain-containing protein [Deltaproteobacteria bacterium]|nr:DUF4258 domain-containing protein [Deltaproteobacteria bacterium]
MQWREISEDEIAMTIRNPDTTEDSTKGRRKALKRIGKKLLKVTYKEEGNRIVIITAIDRNR